MADVMPVSVPLRLYRGDTRVWEDTFSVDGDPMDLTGYTFLAQIRATADAEPMAILDVEVLDAAAGTLRRTLTATEADKLVPGRAVWDFQITSAAGYTRTVMAGPVTVVADVSRVVP
jgi:hypothetical protein